MHQLWVGPPTDRIRRGGGSVVVSAAGAIDATLAPSQAFLITGNNPTNYALKVQNVGAAGRGLIVIGSAGAELLKTSDSSMTIGNTLLVTGTGTHTFSGSVRVSTTAAVMGASGGLSVACTDLGASPVFRVLRGAAIRTQLSQASNDDAVWYAVTGAAGSEVYNEALRIVNANGYVSCSTRFGVGTASPASAFHNAGESHLASNTGVGTAPTSAQRLIVNTATTTQVAGWFSQSAANATAPVLVVKLGATPGAGGDALQVQSSAGTFLVGITGDGRFEFASLGATAPSNPSGGRAKLWYDATANAFKYINSAGAVKTITAA